MTSVIVIEYSVTIPNIGRRKIRGQVNLFELLSFQPNACICIQVPALTKTSYGVSGGFDALYLSFNLSLVMDEYLLSNVILHTEFSDP